MFSIIECVRYQHEPGLLLVAAVVCIVSSLATFHYYSSSMRVCDGQKRWRLAAAGAVCGSGVWSTHFIAMLGYCPKLPIAFNPWGTAASLAIVVAGAVGGFLLTQRPRLDWAAGLLIGICVGAMHYVGVAAVRTVTPIAWDGGMVAASLLLGALGGTAALRIARPPRSGLKPPATKLAAAILVLSVLSLHLTGMSAIRVIPAFSAQASGDLVTRGDLAMAVSAVVSLIMAAAIGLILVEGQARQLSLRALTVAFEGLPSGLALFGADGRLTTWNAAYGAIVTELGLELHPGISRQDLIDDCTNLAGPGGPDRVSFTLHPGTPCPGWTIVTPDDREFVNRAHLLPDGGLISVIQDVTETRRTERALTESRDRAQAASDAKSRFLANMSHEVRTPLNGMLGMIQAISLDPLSELQRERLDVVQEAGRTLLTTLNDVLDFSKIGAGAITLEATPFDAVALAQTVGRIWRGSADARDLGLTVETSSEAQGGWLGDPLRVRQVLSNLVCNALKFTETGGVSLSVDVCDGQLVFEVRDTGIGMDPNQVDQLFEGFAQGDTSTTRRRGGAGLGLPICRELVALMDGMIQVDALSGEGSCFRVTLPLARVELAAEASIDRTRPSPETLRVLAAEDNPTNQLVLRALLNAIGADLSLVGDGAEAVRAFCEQTFDLVLMDIQMPELDGVAAARAIRAIEARDGLAQTPIIAVTANVMPEQIEQYRLAGMNDCIAKPIELERLLGAIQKTLELQHPSPSSLAIAS